MARPFGGWGVQLLFTMAGLGIASAAAALASPGNASAAALFAFVPIAAVIGTVNWIAAAVVGLPLRLVRPLWTWWNANPRADLIGLAVGALLFVLSLVLAVPGVEIDPAEGYEFAVRTPVFWMFWPGWALIAFCLAHFPMDARWRSAPAEPVRGD